MTKAPEGVVACGTGGFACLFACSLARPLGACEADGVICDACAVVCRGPVVLRQLGGLLEPFRIRSLLTATSRDKRQLGGIG